ncbi:MAG: NAD(+) synthetase, partial [Dehalococcoidia bacterium]|nr:NAD(+) synthetase [Dehalococcoidia bacterium]
GLWSGQTDEMEMGLTYSELDRYLVVGEAEEETREKIDSMMVRSGHKHCAPPVPPFYM